MNRHFLFTSVIILLASCNNSTTDFPTQAPHNFYISTNEGGGMSGDYSEVSIRQDSCHYTTGFIGGRNSLSFQLDSVEFEELYQFILSQDFQKIQTEESSDIVYDAPSTSLNISFNNKSFNYSSGASDNIIAGASAFHSIIAKMYQIASEKTKDKYHQYSIKLDTSLLNLGKDFYLSFESIPYSFSAEDTVNGSEIPISIFDGAHQFQCGLLNPEYNYGQNGVSQYFATAFFDINVGESNRSGTISYQDSSLVFTESNNQ